MKTFRSNKLKSQFLKLFWITLAWTLISCYQFSISYTAILNLNCDLGNISPLVYLGGAILTGILAGIIGGGSLVFVWEKWLRSINYGKALMYMFFSYIIIYLLVAIPSAFFFQSNDLGLSFFDPQLRKAVLFSFFEISQLSNFIVWLVIVMGTLIILQVSDKYGPGIFSSFLLGKYFQPTREERIFMFLDLRSSTTIAERLGEVRYFNFIKDVFKDATPPIIYAKGEIYQYVGDEIIISWKMDNGIQNANCINCFFEIQSALRQRNKYYESTYDGIQPEFKAGLHYGHVMAGEIGVVKRDIAYSGDVLNTAARIQSKCNELGVNILFSKYLLDKISLKPNLLTPTRIGDMKLRGKKNKVLLYTVSES
ncbi:MAG: adenylate cyclase [Granulosicoccus sp.]|jgi:adenylate cyclase